MKRIILLLIAIVYAIISHAQGEALVTFTSAKHIPVELYKPIDGACQFESISEELDLKPTMAITYKFEVNDFTVIQLRMSYNKVCLFLFPGDHVTVHYIDREQIKITGSNAEAHTYYNNNFVIFGTMNYIGRMRNMAMEADDFGKMVADLEQTMLQEVKDSLTLLRQNPEISSELISLLWGDLSIYLYKEIQTTLFVLALNRTLSEEEFAAAFAEAEKIFLKIAPPEPNVVRYPFGSGMFSFYYAVLFHMKMNEQERQNLLQGYSDDTFGAYAPYLLAPDYIRLPSLGNGLVLRLKFKMDGSAKLDDKKLYQYLKENYPESEYVALLAKDFETATSESDIPQKDSVYFIVQSVHKLSDFSNLPMLKGKYLLVDLWATWCIPCRQEFAYKHRVKKILDTYPNLALLYISVDEDKRDSAWKTDVEKSQLYGYNIRAQKDLVSDIKEKIFQLQEIDIPRYVLISPDGKLLNADLPRPSAGNELAEALKKYLK